MSSFILGSYLVVTFIVAALLLFQYGNWYRHHIIVTLSVLVAWYFSFVIVFVLPLDICSTTYRQCIETQMVTPSPSDIVNTSYNDNPGITSHPRITSNLTTIAPPPDDIVCEKPGSYVSPEVFGNLWRVVYWSSQVLTWLILPMMQSYTQAGEFTVKGKLKSALLDNAIYYGSYVFICGILLAYIAVKPDLQLDNWQKIKGIAAAASNTWGLFLLVFMLGYGLVAFPRSIWYSSNLHHSLNSAYFRTAKLSLERSSAEEDLDDVLETLQLCMKKLPERSPLYKHLDTIQTQIPVEFRERMLRRRIQDSGDVIVDEKLLVKTHRKLKRALHVYGRTEKQWEDQVTYTLVLEDIDKNSKSRERKYRSNILSNASNSRTIFNNLNNVICSPTIQWYWRCLVENWVLKALAICAGVMSVMVIWSEATFFIRSPPISLFALFLGLARLNYDYATIEAISTITIAYLAVCAFYTVFKVRVFNFYYLAQSHQTNEYSLIFAGMLLCRLTPPLCLNFLGMVHMDSHVIEKRILETMYTQVMGHMDVLSLVSDGFNIYFPMGILVVGTCTWMKVGARFLSVIGFQQFLADDEITTDLVSDGVQLIQREKRRRARSQEYSERMRNLNDKLRRDRDTGQSAAREANEAVDDLHQLEYDRTSILGAAQRGARAYGSPENSAHGGSFVGSQGFGVTGGRSGYQPPRDLFDDV